MDNRCFDFLYEAFGGGSYDWNYLFNKMDDFELEPSEIVEYVKDCTSEPRFNDFMYACLSLGSEKMKDILINYVNKHCNNPEKIVKAIEDYEVNIYINYLDSSFIDNVFSQFSYQELVDEDKQRKMLEMLLDELGIKCNFKNDWIKRNS